MIFKAQNKPNIQFPRSQNLPKTEKNGLKILMVFSIYFFIDFSGFSMNFGSQNRTFFDRLFDVKQKPRFCKNMRFTKVKSLFSRLAAFKVNQKTFENWK